MRYLYMVVVVLVFVSVLLRTGSALADDPVEEEAVSVVEISAVEFIEINRRLEKLEVGAADEEEAEPAWYEELEFGFGATAVLQDIGDGSDSLGPVAGATHGSVAYCLELSRSAGAHGMFYTLFESGNGAGIDETIPSLFGFNDTANDDPNINMAECWYENSGVEDMWRLRMGKVDMSAGFDTNAVANCGASQFMSAGFANSLVVEFPEENALGAMLWVSPTEQVDLGIGVADTNADWNDVFARSFYIVEMNIKPMTGNCLHGNYRLYYWLNDADHEDLHDLTAEARDNQGFGVSIDQELSDVVTLFGRYGCQDGAVSQVENAWSAGLQLTGFSSRRVDDSIGLAYGVAKLSEEWETSSMFQGADPGDEQHMEMYYSYVVNENVVLSPDFQWARNTEGHADRNSEYTFGIRMDIAF